jgi:hypothetical protein
MPYMKDFDFSGLKICNAFISENSRYFCVGSVAKELPGKLERKNDKRSIVGIFKIDPSNFNTSLEMWIIQVSLNSATNFDVVPLQELLRG